jgi:hypothetical protein
VQGVGIIGDVIFYDTRNCSFEMAQIFGLRATETVPQKEKIGKNSANTNF